MVPGVCAGKMWAAQLCRRPWTMLVELVLTAAPSFKMGLASNPTQWWLTAPMLPTATTRGRARPSRPVISLALPSLSPLTQVISEKNSSKFFMNFFLVHFQLILITFLADFAGQSGCTYPATPRYNFSCRNLKNTIFFKLLICEPKKSVFLGLVCFFPFFFFSAAGTSGTPSNSSPTTPGLSPLTPGSSTGSLTPNTPTTGTGTGGAFGSLGPSGTGLDGSDSNKMSSSLLLTTVLVSALALLWGLEARRRWANSS